MDRLLTIFALTSQFLRNFNEEKFAVRAETKIIDDYKIYEYKESIPLLSSRTDLIRRSPVHHHYKHEVTFVLRQNNLDQLVRVLHDVSDPASPNYGQHWSSEQVAALTRNIEARDSIITYLHKKGASIVTESPRGDYITALAPVSIWEEVLNTQFFTFHQRQHNGDITQVVRAESYSVPKALDRHIMCVFNAIEIPVLKAEDRVASLNQGRRDHGFKSSEVEIGLDPQAIKDYYNLSYVVGGSSSTQAAFSIGENYFSPKGLSYFQQFVAKQPLQAALTVGGFVSDDVSKSYTESASTMQYMMGISPGSPTTFWHSADGTTAWLLGMAELADPPRVLTITFGQDESLISDGEQTAFTLVAQALGVMGVTILVASGDDGVHSQDTKADPEKCGYQPRFPATNPFVTAVGATSGPERGTAEVTCQYDKGRYITSGGGFSSYFSRPAWQDDAVDQYFTAVTAAGDSIKPGYNRSGRGYPDLSLGAVNYGIGVPSSQSPDGGLVYKAGTASSCAVAAGFISNINAARFAAGRGSVGWINPALYANQTVFANDVTVGGNSCQREGPCCPQGFPASRGWDPATGIGSVNYDKMERLFLALGADPGFISPSRAPVTRRPSNAPRTVPPTRRPTTVPTFSPSQIPSSVPSESPSTTPITTSFPSTKPIVDTSPPITPTATLFPATAPRIVSSRPTTPPSTAPMAASSLPTTMPSVTLFPFAAPFATSSPSTAPENSLVPSSVLSLSPTRIFSAKPTFSPAPSRGTPLAPFFPSTTSSPSEEVPAAVPTSVKSRRAIIRGYQSYLGINTSDVTSDRFMATTGKFISTSIGALSRTDVRVSDLNPTPVRRLAGTLEVVGVPVEFTVNVTSGMTPVEVIAKMQRSMDRGEFLDIVANDLGLSITNTTRAYFIDVTDEEPSAAPSGPIVPRAVFSISRPSSSTTIIAAAVGGCVGGLMLIVVLLIYYNFYYEPKPPAPKPQKPRVTDLREDQYGFTDFIPKPLPTVPISDNRFLTPLPLPPEENQCAL